MRIPDARVEDGDAGELRVVFLPIALYVSMGPAYRVCVLAFARLSRLCGSSYCASLYSSHVCRLRSCFDLIFVHVSLRSLSRCMSS